MNRESNVENKEAKTGLEKAGHVVRQIGLWIYRLRGFILAIPVVMAALRLADINSELLPDMVGLNLLASGEYSYMVSREAAVYGPLAVTGLCLLMVIMSKKTLYPWIVSIFSLALPLIILLTNVFPS